MIIILILFAIVEVLIMTNYLLSKKLTAYIFLATFGITTISQENTTEIDVPLKVEYGFGTNWREAH